MLFLILALSVLSSSCALMDALDGDIDSADDPPNDQRPDAGGEQDADIFEQAPDAGEEDIDEEAPDADEEDIDEEDVDEEDVDEEAPDAGEETGVQITLEPSTPKVFVGDQAALGVTILGINGEEYDLSEEVVDGISWEIDQEEVAEVRWNGAEFELRGVRDGATAIRAEFEGARSAQLEFEVVRWAQIKAGGEFSCGLLTDGQAFCWGSNNKGQLGIGDEHGGTKAQPTPVAGGLVFTSISVGKDHACGVSDNSDGYCWGANQRGQLGIGATGSDREFEYEPEEVTGGLSFKRILAGGGFSCGVTFLNELYCWGDSSEGRVGRSPGAPDHYYEPQQINDLPNIDPASLVLGKNHVCAKSLNAMRCWGSNKYGQLGDGGQAEYSFEPVAPKSPPMGEPRFKQFALGAEHTCALSEDERLHCWGANDFQQTNPGGWSGRVNEPKRLDLEQRFRWVTSGPMALSSCALSIDNQLYCWGDNQSGSLGIDNNGATLSELTPVATSYQWSQVSLGLEHSCGVTSDRSEPGGYCWGNNESGQLGVSGSTTSTPVVVSKPAL